MESFKHDSSFWYDERAARLIADAGLTGYGFYWRVMEIIAARADGIDRNSATYPKRMWCMRLSIRNKTWDKLMAICEQAGLLEAATDGKMVTVKSHNILKCRGRS